FLACGIGLPIDTVAGGDMNGLRFGTPELVRWGVTVDHVDAIAALVARALRSNDPESIAGEVRKLRGQFQTLRYVL
ncbi:MAG: serine hydroxymethyltransferase, partial [Proteobacteria bacterium]|nr:serine hydroxymethyltransferase [Pseudomonadota bacterium]